MEVLKKLAEALETEEAVILEKLKIDEKADSKTIAKALGVYGLFQNKDELESYIKSKLSNKMNTIDTLNSKLEEKEKIVLDLNNSINSLKEKNDKLGAHFLSNFENKWNEMKLPKIDFKTQIKVDEIDYSKISDEVLRIAKELKLEPNVITPKQIINSNEKIEANLDGVTKFEVGAMRTK